MHNTSFNSVFLELFKELLLVYLCCMITDSFNLIAEISHPYREDEAVTKVLFTTTEGTLKPDAFRFIGIDDLHLYGYTFCEITNDPHIHQFDLNCEEDQRNQGSHEYNAEVTLKLPGHWNWKEFGFLNVEVWYQETWINVME